MQSSTSGVRNAQKYEQFREKLRQIGPVYRSWLNEDAVYIITPEERKAFLQLNSDTERDQFIEMFWQRRNPTPDEFQNPVEEEHYRRIEFANEHFAAVKLPWLEGWKTDRGRIYIILGPPDEIESRQLDVLPPDPMHSGSTEKGPYPEEIWKYNCAPEHGDDLHIAFVDATGNGNFRLVQNPQLDRLFGAAFRAEKRNGVPCGNTPVSTVPKTIELYVGPVKSPIVEFKDLEAMVTAHIHRDDVKFHDSEEFEPVTSYSTLVHVEIAVDPKALDASAHTNAGELRARVFGRLMDATGRVDETFEGVTSGDYPSKSTTIKDWPAYRTECVLRSGTYSLALAVGDPITGKAGTAFATITVPPKKN
jgi:GWxTD domain-containing protein